MGRVKGELSPPDAGLWRIGKAPDPLAYVTLRGFPEFVYGLGNRFDVPWLPVLYFGTSRAACFGETLARFRPSPRLVGLIREEWVRRGWMSLGSVPADWRLQRLIVRAAVSPGSVFLDVEDTRTLEALSRDPGLAPLLADVGIREPLDVPTIRGPDRRVTQLVSSWACQQRNEDGSARYAGLRYLSRLNSEWECWAVFDATRLREISRSPIEKNDPELAAVLELWGLTLH